MNVETLKRVGAAPLAFAATMVVVLFVANVLVTTKFISPSEFTSTANLAVPAIIAAMASAPAILGGGGGFDLSVGPQLGFVNVVLIGLMVPNGLGSGIVAIPLCLLIGIGLGLLNGLLITGLRLQAIVVTLGAYLVLGGVALIIMPQAVGRAPDWITWLAGGWGDVPRSPLVLVAALAVWWIAKRVGYVRALEAVGSEERAAFTAGVRINVVRVASYVLDGLLAALAGIAVTVLIGSGDPNVGPQYTLISVAAVALGGNALTGGEGNMLGPILGAIVIFLLQNLLAALNVSSLWIQISYGAVLLIAVMPNATVRRYLTGRQAVGV